MEHASKTSGLFGRNTDCQAERRTEYPHADLTRLIIWAFFDLYNELGHGFSERVYRNALAVLLRERLVPVVVEQPAEFEVLWPD